MPTSIWGNLGSFSGFVIVQPAHLFHSLSNKMLLENIVQYAYLPLWMNLQFDKRELNLFRTIYSKHTWNKLGSLLKPKAKHLPISSSVGFCEYAEIRLSLDRNGLIKVSLSLVRSNLGNRSCLVLVDFWMCSLRNRASDLRASNSPRWSTLLFLLSFDRSYNFLRLMKNKVFSSFLQHTNSLLKFLKQKKANSIGTLFRQSFY